MNLREAMGARTTDELRRICTDDAPDYTEEALSAARDELRARGEDVSSLVAGERAPTEAGSPARNAAVGLVVLLFGAAAVAPFRSAMPTWALVAIEAAFGAAAFVLARQFWVKK